MSESDIFDDEPCCVCGSEFYERDDEGIDRCVECETPMGEQPGTYDLSIYVLDDEGGGKLYDLRYGVHSLIGVLVPMRKALRHGDIEVKVKTR